MDSAALRGYPSSRSTAKNEKGCMKSMYVSHSERDTLSKSVPTRRDTSEEEKALRARRSFGRVSGEITADPFAKDSDVRVYSGMTLLERGGVVNCGVRWIGHCCNKSRSQVSRAIKNLIRCGYVNRLPARRGQRSTYVLTSVVFKGNHKNEENSSPHFLHTSPLSPQERTPAKLSPCLKCGKICKPSKADGWCRKCVQDNRMRGIARQEIKLDKRESA